MIWQFNPCKSRETLNFHTVPTVVIGMLRSDGWRFGFAFNKSFPTVYFGADVSASCLCWKDAAWDWFSIKKSRHMAGNSHYADIISYPLFADADTGIYPHAASQYHARPKAKRGIAMLSVDKFPYPRKQTRGNEFIPCSDNICDILKRFRSFKIPAITLIWPKSSYKHSITRSYRSGKESGQRSESPLWRHQWRSFVFISHADDVKREIRLHISRLLTNQKRESARSMG